MLVDSSVNVPPHTGDADVGFVDEPAIADTVPARPSRLDDQRGEALHPSVDRDVIDFDAAFGQEFFDIAVGQAVAEIPAHCQQDHVGREPESSERRRCSTATRNHPGTLRPAPDPSTQQSLREYLELLILHHIGYQSDWRRMYPPGHWNYEREPVPCST